MSKNIKYLMMRELESQIRLGQSKRADKIKNKSRVAKFIHNGNTAREYMRHTGNFGDYLRSIGLNKCSFEEAQMHAEEFIKSAPSIFTQYAIRSALARVFHCKGPALCILPPRKASDIKRGRKMTSRALAVEKNHPELPVICRSIGARHKKEFLKITANDFFYKDGDLYCHIIGKGGRPRDAIVPEGRGKKLIEEIISKNPTGTIFRSYSDANIHRYRADYAARIYEEAIKRGKANGKLYKVRDGSGRVYDKGCLAYVNEMLGHGDERGYTAIHNYLSYGESKE